MKIQLNDETIELKEPLSLNYFLELYNLNAGKIAVAVNKQLIPRVLYEQTELVDQDIIDIIIPMNGG